KERENILMFYFKEKEVEKQVKIFVSTNVVPYNGFSFYKMEYLGELPKSLIKAYQKMNEFNDTSPRKEFKEERMRSRASSGKM
ncbi:MAG: hypothetical protein ACK4ND_18520, partial [Cytophagaceae bacterium]